MKIIEVYTAHATIDEYSRLGALHGVFFTEDDANHVAHKIGWYGGKGSVSLRKGLESSAGKIFLLDQQNPDEIKIGVDLVLDRAQQRSAALDKLKAALTETERHLLGISELK